MPQNFRFRQGAIVISIIATCLFWAVVYTYQATGDPFGGNEAALFIQPLFYLLLIAAIWCAVEAAISPLAVDDPASDQRQPAKTFSDSSSTERKENFGASGLADWRRLAVILSLPLMVMLTWLLGFVISSAAYVTALGWCLGERRAAMLAGLAAAAVAVVWLFFSKSLGVPLPLWPRWVG